MTTGETERALRAVAKLLETDALEPCQIGAQREIWSIAKAEAIMLRELLPLFNSGIAGAYAAAAKLCELHAADAEYMDDGVERMVKVAHHFDAKTILALTPADARQASQQSIEVDGCDRDAACNLAKEHEGECSFSGAQLSQLTALFDATYADLQQVKRDSAAAIASAEARARLEGKQAAYKTCATRLRLNSEIDGDAAEREARYLESLADNGALITAARTPDSTKEPG